jgi:small subunit ribosomal protein S2
MPQGLMRALLESGVHFGHQTSRWNPKMKPYIYGERNGIHIINLQKTNQLLDDAVRFTRQVLSRGDDVLFVGTKRQAKNIIEDEAMRVKMPYVVTRWLGGMLTNFATVRTSIQKLEDVESMLSVGNVEKLPKKEVLKLEKLRNRLLKFVGGVREMKRLPGAVFMVDPSNEHIAVEEAHRLGIPVIALTDTNCDPDVVDFIIPGNDDSIRSIKLISSLIADAVTEGLAAHKERLAAPTDGNAYVEPPKPDERGVEVKELSDGKKEVIFRRARGTQTPGEGGETPAE